MKKICNKCNKEKQLECFDSDISTKDKKKSYCRECRQLKENKEKRRKNGCVPTKVCAICETQKDSTQFHIDKRHSGNLAPICSECGVDKEKVVKNVHKIYHCCTSCKVEKPGNEYPTTRHSYTTIYPRCKQCIAKSRDNAAYKIKIKEEKIKRKEEDPDGYRQKSREHSKRQHQRDPRIRILQQSKKRAKEKGWEYNIEKSDIIIPATCPILKVPFILGNKGSYEYSPSIDRIDNSKGYIKGNVQIITKRANSMKNAASIEELKLLADWINKTFY